MNEKITVDEADEVKQDFMNSVRNIALYWSELPNKTPKERCEGVAFSILNIFDGTSGDMPMLDIVANIDGAETVINDCMLHEQFFKEV